MIVEQREFLAVSSVLRAYFARNTFEWKSARQGRETEEKFSLSLPGESPRVSKITAVQRLRRRVPFCPVLDSLVSMFVDRGEGTRKSREIDVD